MTQSSAENVLNAVFESFPHLMMAKMTNQHECVISLFNYCFTLVGFKLLQ